MKEKTLKKIKKLLAKEGLEEEEINSIVEEIQATEEGADEVPNPDDGGNPTQEEQGDPIPPEVSDEGAQDVPPEEVVPDLPPEEVVPPQEQGPADGSIESTVGALVNGLQGDVPPQEEVPPVDVPPAPAPTIDPQVQELLGQVDELKKANETLLARVDSLEDALKKAGVLEGSQTVGDERPNLPEETTNVQGNILDGILDHINGKRNF